MERIAIAMQDGGAGAGARHERTTWPFHGATPGKDAIHGETDLTFDEVASERTTEPVAA